MDDLDGSHSSLDHLSMEDKFLDHGDKEVDLDEALIPALGKM
jgi:hypothetical protein